MALDDELEAAAAGGGVDFAGVVDVLDEPPRLGGEGAKLRVG